MLMALFLRNTHIDEASPQYWADGFHVDGIETSTPDCPLFTPGFTNPILLTGKTAAVVNKISPTKVKAYEKQS
jgi:hypothetical protein